MDKHNETFWQKSYKSHMENDNVFFDHKKLETWKRFDTIDAWRHNRMYNNLLPIIKTNPGSKWLTIGDGRYGTDANYLIRNGISNVMATSISDDLLKKAKKEGFILEYKVENAEDLSFDDNSVDFVVCKESYHHFPRPMIALYEMLRVSEMGVVIMEPNDRNIKTLDGSKILIKPKNRLQLIKNVIKDFFGIKRYQYTNYSEPGYEEVGNYIYSVSEREFEKVALGLNYPVVAFKGINDYYEEGVEFEIANKSSKLFTKITTAIEHANKACINHSGDYNFLISIIFKIMPEEKTLIELTNIGFEVKRLSRNPYI